MIITLKGADFSQSNIGTLSTWRITRSLGSGATYEGVTSVDKDAAFSATVTLAEGYEVGTAGIIITMGGTTLEGAYTISDNVITITIAKVTGNVIIKVPTINTATGEEEEPDVPDTPGEIINSGVLSLISGAISIVSGEAGSIDTDANKRMNSASTTEARGIWVPAGKTITLSGLAPSGKTKLRFDCLWASSAGPNPKYSSISGNWTAFIGTDSDFNSANFFPHNTSGADSYTVTNNEGLDCYVFFGFAGLTKNEVLSVSDYTITYTIQ